MLSNDYDIIKKEIIDVFNAEVKGVDIPAMTSDHDGQEGDWLTKKMGLSLNSKNEPDYKGFEMKKISDKISFGDWSANYYLWEDNNSLTRSSFLETFGTTKKAGRFSWSGKTFPSKFGIVTTSGQKLTEDIDGNIVIVYDSREDKRDNVESKILENYQNAEIVLARWDYESLKNKFESKFNQYGFFICFKTGNAYSHIKFGPPLDFNIFLNSLKKGDIILDSGMYTDINKRNSRPYQTWRANKSFWLKHCK